MQTKCKQKTLATLSRLSIFACSIGKVIYIQQTTEKLENGERKNESRNTMQFCGLEIEKNLT
jgi:hypothetical protein